MARKAVPKKIETEVLYSSKRICALCFGLKNDSREKRGQIAHLDQNPSNNSFDNLCWLCLEHHAEYDSRSRATKGYQINEVKKHRNNVYLFCNQNIYNKSNEIERVKSFIEFIRPLLAYLNEHGEEVAYMIRIDALEMIASIIENSNYNNKISFDLVFKENQINLISCLTEIYQNFLSSDYSSNGASLIFQWTEDQDHNDMLQEKKKVIGIKIEKIFIYYRKILDLIEK